MKRKNRSWPEICASILDIVSKENPGVTRIMYASFISYKQLNSYMDILLQQRLIARNEHNKRFLITDKGRQFLDLYTNMEEMLNPI
jgi:predicted transcriptional regulator